MFKRSVALFLLSACVVTHSFAGPDDPSKFDPTPYKAQKALYDFNMAKPTDALAAFGYIKNHIKAMKEYGDYKNSHIVLVAHGNELHAFSRLNRAAYPDMYNQLKELADLGVSIRICANAARSRGYKPDEFYEMATVVPAAVIEIAKWQNEGYSYMYAEAFPRLTRDALLAQHPELKM